MATLTFDTHKFVRRLELAGFQTQQAEAVAEAFREASGEAEIATTRDLDQVRQDLREQALRIEARFERLDGKLTLVQWMLALVIAAEVVPVLAQLFR